jgi:hypothetical protein
MSSMVLIILLLVLIFLAVSKNGRSSRPVDPALGCLLADAAPLIVVVLVILMMVALSPH